MYDISGRVYTLDGVLAGVGHGWGKIVQRLIRDLFDLGWDGSVHQIKEKFGGLRFYIGAGSDRIFQRIYEAEGESDKTCEECGHEGKSCGDGWMLTLCETCDRWRKRLRKESDYSSKKCNEIYHLKARIKKLEDELAGHELWSR